VDGTGGLAGDQLFVVILGRNLYSQGHSEGLAGILPGGECPVAMAMLGRRYLHGRSQPGHTQVRSRRIIPDRRGKFPGRCGSPEPRLGGPVTV
jgi:hypothetical protein